MARFEKKRHRSGLRIMAVVLPLLLLSALLSQRAFAKTYVITDGDQVVPWGIFPGHFRRRDRGGASDPAESGCGSQ